MMETKSKLKVALIHPDLGIGGAERLVLDVAGALSKQSKDVVFLTNHYDKTHAFEELKTGQFPVDVYGDWIPRAVLGKCEALCAYIRMVYLVIVYLLFVRKEDKADLFFVDLVPISVPFLKLWGEKVIYYCHHPDLLASEPGGRLKKLYRKPIDWLELKATKQADYILVNSQYTASVFRETFPEITKPIEVLYPTVAYSYQETVKTLKSKSISELINAVPANDNNFVFLSINRFHPAKKLELAIQAMEILLRHLCGETNSNSIYLIMAGGFDPQSSINASYFSKLEQLVKLKKLTDKVILLKSPSDDLKSELLMACDCLIYTPVNEHFGIVPLEAMTVSKPVIACNSGGPRETVDHAATGYLCEPNPESMADFMARMQDRERARAMGTAGKRNLDERFSYESFSRCLENVIESATNQKKID